MSNYDRRAAAQAALKAIAMQETARPAGAARFAALDDGLMRRIDRETTRQVSRVHTRPVEENSTLDPNH